MDRRVRVWFLIGILWGGVTSHKYVNDTLPPYATQLLRFVKEHPHPSLLTTTAGAPVEIRDTLTINTDVLANQFNLDSILNTDGQRIPERTVVAKGNGALGYFEVTHDVSKYTQADIFNGIGKKTPLIGRFSAVFQNLGGSDIARNERALAMKFYTKEGILDFLCLHIPVFFFFDPILFPLLRPIFLRNPETNFYDNNMAIDNVLKQPVFLNTLLWVFSDFGIPENYRRMDVFPSHTYELTNKHGEIHYARLNFRSELGIANLTTAQAQAIQAFDLDYFGKDLYNAIETKNYPSFKLEFDILTPEEIRKVNYNPFDLTKLWIEGTYRTVTVGRVVFNENPSNHFAQVEQLALNPTNLVRGISQPADDIFKQRRLAYKDAHNYRLLRNHNKIQVNRPLYAKTYVRDSQPPVRDNMKDTPNYYPNSFNGPQPTVDVTKPRVRLRVLQSNAVDLEPMADFYNRILTDDAQRQRLAANIVGFLQTVFDPLPKRFIKLLSLVNPDLGQRVRRGYEAQRAAAVPQEAIISEVSQCIQNVVRFPKRLQTPRKSPWAPYKTTPNSQAAPKAANSLSKYYY